MPVLPSRILCDPAKQTLCIVPGNSQVRVRQIVDDLGFAIAIAAPDADVGARRDNDEVIRFPRMRYFKPQIAFLGVVTETPPVTRTIEGFVERSISNARVSKV